MNGLDIGHVPLESALPLQRSVMQSCDDFRFEMLLDWVQLRLTLVKPTQFQYLQKEIERIFGQKPRVDAEGKASHHTDRNFSFYLQDPPAAATVLNNLRQLEQRFAFAAEPQILAIEVSLDSYARNHSRESLVQMVEHLARCITDPPSDNRRIAGPRGSRGLVEGTFNREVTRMRLDENLPLHVGNIGDPRTLRAYLKENDAKGPRARLENTLRGQSAPFSTVEEWGTFDFRGLSRYFRFRRTTPPTTELSALLQERRTTLSRPRQADTRAGHRRVHLAGTKASRDFSDHARNALARLTRQQQRGFTSAWSRAAHSAGIWVPAERQVIDSLA